MNMPSPPAQRFVEAIRAWERAVWSPEWSGFEEAQAELIESFEALTTNNQGVKGGFQNGH